MNAQLREPLNMPARLAPYPQDRIDDILESLHGMVPGIGSVRTDRFQGAEISTSNPQRIIIEHGNGKRFRMGMPAQLMGAPIGHIRSNLNIESRYAEKVLKDCMELATLNPMGSWCVTPSQVDDLVVSVLAAGDQPIERDSYLAETCDMLAENFPTVGRIEIDYRITDGNMGGATMQRRRAFMRFFARDGRNEVAAIDTSGIALHARHQILKPKGEEMLDLNLWRMEFWADTLGTTPDHLAEVFPTMVFLTSALHVTRLDLP